MVPQTMLFKDVSLESVSFCSAYLLFLPSAASRHSVLNRCMSEFITHTHSFYSGRVRLQVKVCTFPHIFSLNNFAVFFFTKHFWNTFYWPGYAPGVWDTKRHKPLLPLNELPVYCRRLTCSLAFPVHLRCFSRGCTKYCYRNLEKAKRAPPTE